MMVLMAGALDGRTPLQDIKHTFCVIKLPIRYSVQLHVTTTAFYHEQAYIDC